MRLILKYLKNYKLLVVVNVISVFGFALVELGIPTIMAKVIDSGIANKDIQYIKRMGGVIVLIFNFRCCRNNSFRVLFS